MSKPLAALVFIAALLTVPADAAWLSDADAARLAELAFTSGTNAQHMEMTADNARHLRGAPRFVSFRSDFALGEDQEGIALFIVDRRTGAVWAVDVHRCDRVAAPALENLRAALHLTERRSSPPPPAKYCTLV